MRTPGERVVQRIKQKSIVAMCACHPTHSRHIIRRHRAAAAGWRARAWRQVDDALAVGPRTRDPLGCSLADEQTIAGTADVFAARRRVTDWGGLVALGTLDHVLVFLTRYVDHILAHLKYLRIFRNLFHIAAK